MNKVMLCGRLTKDVDMRTAQSGTPVGRFTLAVDRIKRQGEEKSADFINCVAFDKKATFISTYFGKGRRIIVIGRIQTSNYTDKDGKNRTSVDVIVEDAEFCDSKSDANSTPAPASAPAPTPQPDSDGFVNLNDVPEELPFF